jgi:hypothetical protein
MGAASGLMPCNHDNLMCYEILRLVWKHHAEGCDDSSRAKIASASCPDTPVAAACWLRGRPHPDHGLMSSSFRRVIRRAIGELLYARLYARMYASASPRCVHVIFEVQY